MQRRSDEITGAKAIAYEMGCSVHTVYRQATDPASPIFKPAGRYRANRHELKAWLRRKPEREHPKRRA